MTGVSLNLITTARSSTTVLVDAIIGEWYTSLYVTDILLDLITTASSSTTVLVDAIIDR